MPTRVSLASRGVTVGLSMSNACTVNVKQYRTHRLRTSRLALLMTTCLASLLETSGCTARALTLDSTALDRATYAPTGPTFHTVHPSILGTPASLETSRLHILGDPYAIQRGGRRARGGARRDVRRACALHSSDGR
ncbi:hypothetical protein GY45DRAFT_84795 [Cubamyces sp. BRFM 1775]|nr:hypothetical protein GY45DRAFT_84795 [Cubamyces sp. BRFM 1775]